MEGLEIFLDKKIVFFEIDYHAEVLDGFVAYSENYNLDVVFVLSQKVYEKSVLKNLNKYKVLIFDRANALGFLKRNTGLFETCDLILFNTIDNSPEVIAKFDKYLRKSILRIHNANTTFAPFRFFNVPNSPFLLWKESSHFIRKIVLRNAIMNTNLIVKKAAYLLPADKAMHNYLVSQFSQIVAKLLPALPFYPLDSTKSEMVWQKKEHFKIVVPGKVDYRRRDYDLVFKLIEKMEFSNVKISLVFLGNSNTNYGTKVRKKFEAIFIEKGVELVFFDSFVSKEDFSFEMKTCDFILCPIKRRTVFGVTKEYYGASKVSGVYFDAVKNHKILFAPNDVFNEDEYVVTFDRNDPNALNNFIFNKV